MQLFGLVNALLNNDRCVYWLVLYGRFFYVPSSQAYGK